MKERKRRKEKKQVRKREKRKGWRAREDEGGEENSVEGDR